MCVAPQTPILKKGTQILLKLTSGFNEVFAKQKFEWKNLQDFGTVKSLLVAFLRLVTFSEHFCEVFSKNQKFFFLEFLSNPLLSLFLTLV